MRLITALTLKTTILTFLLFAWHRGLTFGHLFSGVHTYPLHMMQIALVGLMSDLWIASLMGVSTFAGLCVEHLFKRKRPLFHYFSLGLVVLFVFFHQSYVEFFRVTLIPFHLTYIWDFNFVRANGSSAFSGAALLTAAFAGCIIALSQNMQRQKWMRSYINLTLLLATGIVSHVLNIHYRIQWLVPDNLRMNAWEALHANLGLYAQPIALTSQDFRHLRHLLRPTNESDDPKSYVFRTELPKTRTHAMQLIINEVKQRQAQKQPVLLLTILVESLRAVDVHANSPYGSISYTPELDHLSTTGVLFNHAWSSGTVTRGGQEATWCGYLGSTSSSTMRSHPEVILQCLPQIHSGVSFWFHGGKRNFDNQYSFWRNHGVKTFLAQEDFDNLVPKTGWGVSDRELFHSAAPRIRALMSEQQEPVLGMILTVTNHVPWALPVDAPPHIKRTRLYGKHGSAKTLLYTDFAIGEFVDFLKEAKIWEHTILIINGDHGNTLRPLKAPLDTPKPILLSKVFLLLSGGIIESLVSQGDLTSPMTHHVSQTDIAAFWQDLLDKPLATQMGEPLFQAVRTRPIISDLDYGIFLPALGKVISRESAYRSRAMDKTDSATRAAVLYYRNFISVIHHWQGHAAKNR